MLFASGHLARLLKLALEGNASTCNTPFSQNSLTICYCYYKQVDVPSAEKTV